MLKVPWITETRGEDMFKGFVYEGHSCLMGWDDDDDDIIYHIILIYKL